MVNKNVLSCLLKDGKEVNAVMLVGRLFHARATVTRNDRSPMVRETTHKAIGKERSNVLRSDSSVIFSATRGVLRAGCLYPASPSKSASDS